MPKDKKSRIPKKKPPRDVPKGAPPGPTKNYSLRGSLIFAVSHILLVIFVIVWSFGRDMFSGQGIYFSLYLIELPGIMITKIVGEAKHLDVMAPYAIAFFINTLFYAAVGYGVGYLFQRWGWVKETRDIFLTQEEQQKQLIPPRE